MKTSKKKLLWALLALVLSVGLHAYVITVENPESTGTFYNVPVVLQGESLLTERGLMIVGGDNPTITLELRGNRKHLNKLKSSDITVIADVTKIYGTGQQSVTYDVFFPGDIPDNSISTERKTPDMVTFAIARRITRNVDVEIKFSGAVAEDYIADKDNPVLDNNQVTITGPEDVVNQVAMARIDVELAGRTESISENYRYTLCNEAGEPVDVAMVTTNLEEVRLNLRIQRRKEIPLVVNVVDGGGATRQTSSIDITPKTIWVSGNDTALSTLNEINLGTVNLAQVLQDSTLRFAVNLPEGITNESNVTEAEVTISFPALITREFNVIAFRSVNVPEGMKVEYLTTQLTVAIRGPREQMINMRAGDITVTVDFTGEEAGTNTFKAVASVGTNYAGCGPLNSYSVSATLRPAEPEPTDTQQ